MKNIFFFSKKIVFVIFLLIICSCEKDNLIVPSDLKENFQVEESNLDFGSLKDYEN